MVVRDYLQARRTAGFRNLVWVLGVTPLLKYLRVLGAAPAARTPALSALVDTLLAEFARYPDGRSAVFRPGRWPATASCSPVLAGLALPLDAALPEGLDSLRAGARIGWPGPDGTAFHAAGGSGTGNRATGQ